MQRFVVGWPRSGDKVKCGADGLIHADNLTQSSGLAYMFKVTNTLVAPWSIMCLTIGTTGASGRIHSSEDLGNKTTPSHNIQSGEVEVPEGFINSEEQQLLATSARNVDILLEQGRINSGIKDGVNRLSPDGSKIYIGVWNKMEELLPLFARYYTSNFRGGSKVSIVSLV